MMTRFARIGVLLSLFALASARMASAQGIAVSIGPNFASFSSDALDFDNRTGLQAGVAIGGARTHVLGVQTEINWVRKEGAVVGGPDVRLDYIQVPVFLRVNIGTQHSKTFDVYGIVGPSFSYLIANRVAGSTLDDGFQGFDAGIIGGVGVEIYRFTVEGRYEKGFRHINSDFLSTGDINTKSFTILFGVRLK